jgi:hypothetical protein
MGTGVIFYTVPGAATKRNQRKNERDAPIENNNPATVRR